jgi:hypothetical protein
MKRLLSVTALAVAFTGVMAATPILTLNPSDGVVSGTPGSTVGWGFTLTNDSGFLIPSAVVFCEGAFNAGCTPTFGTFTDFAAQSQFNIVGAMLTETFHDATEQGIGSFTINFNAPTGVTDVGTIYLVYDTFSCDITENNCNATQTAFSQIVSAPASVNIVGTAAVPEPESAGLLALGLALLLTAGWRKAALSKRLHH